MTGPVGDALPVAVADDGEHEPLGLATYIIEFTAVPQFATATAVPVQFDEL